MGETGPGLTRALRVFGVFWGVQGSVGFRVQGLVGETGPGLTRRLGFLGFLGFSGFLQILGLYCLGYCPGFRV